MQEDTDERQSLQERTAVSRLAFGMMQAFRRFFSNGLSKKEASMRLCFRGWKQSRKGGDYFWEV